MHPPVRMIRMVLTRRRIRRGRPVGGMFLGAFVAFASVKGGEADRGGLVTEIYRVVCLFHGPCPNTIGLQSRNLCVDDHGICLKQLVLTLCSISFLLLSFSSKLMKVV